MISDASAGVLYMRSAPGTSEVPIPEVKEKFELWCGENNLHFHNCEKHAEWRSFLEEFKYNPDFVFIASHGMSEFFCLDSGGGSYSPILRGEDTNLFLHDCIFAYSCHTVNGLGAEAVKNGCLAYIGFNGYIGRHLGNNAEFTGVATEAIVYCIKRFIEECWSVDELVSAIKFELASYDGSSQDDEYELYGVDDILEWLNNFSNKLARTGDSSYTPWISLAYCPLELLDDLYSKAKSNLINLEVHNRYYGFFIDCIYNARKGLAEDYRTSLSLLELELGRGREEMRRSVATFKKILEELQ